MSTEFQNVRIKRETVAKALALLESMPGANHSLNSFCDAAIEAIVAMIGRAPGDRREPDIVRVFDVFASVGQKLPTKPAPVSLSRAGQDEAERMALALKAAEQSNPRGAVKSAPLPGTDARSGRERPPAKAVPPRSNPARVLPGGAEAERGA
jgi:hypothetical protein